MFLRHLVGPTLANCDLSKKIFTEIVPGELLSQGGLNRRRVAKYDGFWTFPRMYLGNGAKYKVSYYQSIIGSRI